jgi:hypothetical protein
VLGPEHPDTLTSMVNLAFTWKGQERLGDALALMQECASLRTRVLGSNHPHTKSSLSAYTDRSATDVRLRVAATRPIFAEAIAVGWAKASPGGIAVCVCKLGMNWL